MSRPSRSTVNNWDLSSLRTQSASLIAAAITVRTQTQAVVDAVQGAGNWYGESQRACEARALSDQTEINKLGSDIDRAGHILNNTATAIEPNRTTALSRCEGLEKDGFAVADDWTVTEARDYASAIAGEEVGSDNYNKLVTMRDGRANDAINATVSLQALADQMGIDDQAGADALTDAFGNAEINAPITSGLSRQQAARDAQAIADGTATPQQKARFDAATNLTPEQRDALTQGNDAVISQGQFEYLQGFYAELGKQGLDGFVNFGGNDLSLKSSLADGLQLLANPHVRTDQRYDGLVTDIFGDAFGTPPATYVRGGISKLPSAISDPLTQQAARRGGLFNNDGKDGIGRENSIELPTLEQLGTIADVLGHGDPGVQLGSDIDRALIVRSSEIAGAAIDPTGTYGADFDRIPFSTIESVLDKTLSVAGNDHMAVHDALMTGREEGAHPLAPMMETTNVDGITTTYDADKAMKDLLVFDWSDEEPDSMQARGVTKLFDWIGYDAGASGAEAKLAGDSAEGLAHILIANEGELAGFLPDKDNPLTYRSLGEINPGLTQALATTLSPYLPNFVDVPEDITINDHADELDNVTELSKLFKVLDSDPTAAGIINTAGAQWQNHLAYQYGLDPDRPSLGIAAGQLDEAMKKGMADEIQVLTTNRQWDNIVEYNEDSATYDTIVETLKTVLPDEVASAVNVIDPRMKFNMIDIPNDPKALADDPIELSEVHTEELSSHTIRNYAILEGYAVDNPAIRDYFTYDNGTGRTSFFTEQGKLDWKAIATHRDDFINSYYNFNRDMSNHDLSGFQDAHEAADDEETIDLSSIPQPKDPSQPPMPAAPR